MLVCYQKKIRFYYIRNTKSLFSDEYWRKKENNQYDFLGPLLNGTPTESNSHELICQYLSIDLMVTEFNGVPLCNEIEFVVNEKDIFGHFNLIFFYLIYWPQNTIQVHQNHIWCEAENQTVLKRSTLSQLTSKRDDFCDFRMRFGNNSWHSVLIEIKFHALILRVFKN